MARNLCTSEQAKDFYYRCLYEERHLGIEWVHDVTTLPFVTDSERVLSQVDYDFHNIGFEELAVRASFVLMPDTVRLRVREGHSLREGVYSLKDYNLEQIAWMKRARSFFEFREHHCPDTSELVGEYFGNGTPVYFKIRDVMLHPERYSKSDILKLSDVLHGKMTVRERLYGSPKLPEEIPSAA